MPGILPMKVIKVGTSSQSRIAQACDRCRSKKIRCDGIRPTCTQCSSVGFECRTSDKLSRRAFPRGYTESLEERVRQLETEVRELKDLLDEKDEKIDMLSKMHGNQHRRRSITSDASTPSSAEVNKDSHNSREDTFRVQASPLLLGVENSDSFFMGASSGRLFIETVKRKVQETGKPCSDFNPEAFLHIQGCAPLVPQTAAASSPQVPPRLFSDRCVNVYFQEWAALFPILHKPTFLRIYEEYVADPTKIKSNHKIAQLYLVFSIAGLSSESPDLEQVASCEKQWIKALDAVLMENTMQTLQCLLLALLYCTTRADYKRLQHYKGIAVGLSHRLGLHQSQKRFSFGALTIETRKKVFWTLYTLDCFTSAILGLPKLLKDEDVQAEFPADTDDEYVTEKGFQPTLPGEYTRLSSALALFRATRILASVLEKNYPATTSHELSLQQMGQFEGELNEWKDSLPDHLKLKFVQDKPSTGVTGSRSPLLALAYYYIRTLIYRPAVGSTLGVKAAPALLSVSESSKHMIQIMELLEERSMTFSFCLNKCDVLVLCGMTLLYQVVDLKKDSKMLRDNEHMLNSVMKTLERLGAPGCRALKRVSSMFVAMAPSSVAATPSEASTNGRSSSTAPSQHASPLGSYKKKKNTPYPGRRMEAAASESDLLQQQEKLRRMTMPNTALQRPDLYRTSSRHSLETAPQQELMMRPAEHRNSLSRVSAASHRGTQMPQQRPNLDYLSFSNTPSQTHPSTPAQAYMAPQSLLMAQNAQVGGGNGHVPSKGSGISNTEWEALLGSLDGGMNNVYDAIYGGTSGFINESSISSQTNRSEWSPDSWDLSGFNIGDAGGNPAPAHSVLSISDESLSSGEEVGPSELGLSAGSIDYHQGPLLGDGQHAGGEGDFGFDTLEAFSI